MISGCFSLSKTVVSTLPILPHNKIYFFHIADPVVGILMVENTNQFCAFIRGHKIYLDTSHIALCIVVPDFYTMHMAV